MLHKIILFLYVFTVGVDAFCFGQVNRGLQVNSVSNNESIRSTSYAWIVGVSKYENIPSLQFADSDAILFKQFLMSNGGGQLKKENILLMVNEQAKGNSLIIQGGNWILTRDYKQGDRLYIYLAGHGDAIDKDEYFFLGSDIDLGSYSAKTNYRAGGALMLYTLKMDIKRLINRGVEVILIIDACRTNEIAGGENGQKSFAEGITEKRQGEIMMFSASPSQMAIEGAKIGNGHGLFTWYLIGGMAGAADDDDDNNVTLNELENYVKKNVSIRAKKQFGGHIQNPVFCCSEQNNLSISMKDSMFFNKWVSTESSIQYIALNNSEKSNIKRSIDDTTVAKQNKQIQKNNKILTDDSDIIKNRSSIILDSFVFVSKKTIHNNDLDYKRAGDNMNYVQKYINAYLRGHDQVQARFKTRKFTKNNSKEYEFIDTMISSIQYANLANLLNETIRKVKLDSFLLVNLNVKYHFLKANTYFETGKLFSYDSAKYHITQAIKDDSLSSYLYIALGNIERKKQNFSNAEIAYRRALKLAPTWGQPYNSLGVNFHLLKKFDTAKYYYDLSLKVDSLFSATYNNLGNLFFDLKKYNEAEKYYIKSISIDSGSKIAKSNLNNLVSNKQNNSKTVSSFNNSNPFLVKIANDYWTTYNLSAIRFRNGDNLTFVTNEEDWAKCRSNKIPCYAYYDFNLSDIYSYGCIYNSYAILDDRRIAPIGYHIPSLYEWQKLIGNLGGNVESSLALIDKGKWFNIENNIKNSYLKDSSLLKSIGSSKLDFLPCGYISMSRCYGKGNQGFWWISNLDVSPSYLSIDHRDFNQNSLEIVNSSSAIANGCYIRLIKE